MAGRGLPFELFLAFRYLRARGHRANLSLFVWIGVGGVFLGVSALIVVLAVMTGFQDGIKDRLIAANPHILVVEQVPHEHLDHPPGHRRCDPRARPGTGDGLGRSGGRRSGSHPRA